MDQIRVKFLIDQLNNILSTVHNQNSGADIHEIGNIRNTASLLIDQLQRDPECLTDELATQIVRNTEERVVNFFKKKYPSKKH